MLPDATVEAVAARLRVVAEPTRIRLMELLDQRDATVQGLADALDETTRQNVSKHLAVLHQAGIVSRHSDGRCTRYALEDWTGWWLVDQLARSIDANPPAGAALGDAARPRA
jgi:ArsR family transcriptional regulator